MLSLFSIVLALFGLSFLVFIHELGHYVMAKRAGMHVEVFSIGFGRPILSWKFQGVKWQIGILPFGGFVKIAGMEQEKGLEPHDIPGGFYASKPWNRIKVAFMGPLVNIVFAVLVFTVIWMSGGREKPYAEYTNLIGWVDPNSELYELGVRPGDSITSINGEKYKNFQGLMLSSLSGGEELDVRGEKVNYLKGEKKAYDYTVETFPHPRSSDKDFKTIGVYAPANYLIYRGGMPTDSPAKVSGIEVGDRVMWADGELLFSTPQLVKVVNEGKALLSVKRGDQFELIKVPRVPVRDLRLSGEQVSELDDWHYEVGYTKQKVDEMLFVPYELNEKAEVMGILPYINDGSKEDKGRLLQPGDQILAVDGVPVRSAPELLKQVQEKHVQLIVQRGSDLKTIAWDKEAGTFGSGVDWKELGLLVDSFKQGKPEVAVGEFHKLVPIVPIAYKDFPLTDEQREFLSGSIEDQQKTIARLEDVEKRAELQETLRRHTERQMLGLKLSDRMVQYNPTPIAMTEGIFKEMYVTLSSLVTGNLSPKWLSGPVGIVTLMHYSWKHSLMEALFWLGAISLNLGVLNLLPIPVLDGGHICFSLFEWITRKRIPSKVMQRMIIPFVILLISFFIYVTFQDVTRLFS